MKFQEKEHLFYQFLPYAMTMGIADKWSKAFKEIFDKPPEWFKGVEAGKFKPSGFVSSMSNLSNTMQTAFISKPAPKSSGSGWSSSSGGSWKSSSSFSSGFSSGGGFSGGGFGGGGGGSW